jgi:membrane protein implicated in regulation of membrane protease activity
MNSLFDQIVFWHWWIFAVALLILEAFAPGAVFLWMGISAAVVGLLLAAAPSLGWEWQFIIFAVLSIISVAVYRLWWHPIPKPSDRPTLNRRGEQYVGRNFTLTEGIVNGIGKLQVDDTTWRISGSDLPAGSQVRVTGVDGTTLKVEVA